MVDVLELELLEKLPDLKSPLELLLELELLLVLLDLGEEKLPDLKSPLELELLLFELELLLVLGEEKLLDLKLLDLKLLLKELLAWTVIQLIFVFKTDTCGEITYTHKNKKVSNRDMIKCFLFNLILHTSLLSVLLLLTGYLKLYMFSL